MKNRFYQAYQAHALQGEEKGRSACVCMGAGIRGGRTVSTRLWYAIRAFNYRCAAEVPDAVQRSANGIAASVLRAVLFFLDSGKKRRRNIHTKSKC